MRHYAIALLLVVYPSITLAEVKSVDEYLGMSLDDLMNTEITSVASLTDTSRRKTPSTVTTITKQQIRESGARNLIELLEIYVPNFQWLLQTGGLPVQLGSRGIASNDKQMIRVNGRVTNIKTTNAILSEIDQTVLTDIYRIDVIRGPGSALHGPGALGMVVDIHTENGQRFQGIESTLRAGVREEFLSAEAKAGVQFKNGGGLFGFAGVTDYDGAEHEYAPIYSSKNVTVGGTTYGPKDNLLPYGDNYNRNFRDRLKRKFHLQYTHGGLDVWGRYVNGGVYTSSYSRQGEQTGYTQSTVHGDYTWNLSDQFGIIFTGGFDEFSRITERLYNDGHMRINQNFKEEEYLGKVVGRWTPRESFSAALGGSYAYERFGLPHEGIASKNGGVPWDTELYSLFGEINWQANKYWQFLFGGRSDWHTFTDAMLSPRLAVIATPTDKDTVKLMISRSVRTNPTSEMLSDLQKNPKPDVETLLAYELRYERMQTPNTLLATGVFIHDNDFLGNTSDGRKLAGTMHTIGIELEAVVKTEKTSFNISQTFTKLYDYEKNKDYTSPHYSPASVGIGMDNAFWSNLETKASFAYNILESLKYTASLIVYWDHPGDRDYITYNHGISASRYTLDNYEPTGTSAYLNMGLHKELGKHVSAHIHGHSLLGFIDKDLNRRGFWVGGSTPGAYRNLPASLSFSLVLKN